MKLRAVVLIFCGLAVSLFITACVHSQKTSAGGKSSIVATNQFQTPVTLPAPAPTNFVLSTKPLYVPDISHSKDPLPDGVIAWDSVEKTLDVPAETNVAVFSFSFTNIMANDLAILEVHPSCGCTTAELPTAMPWMIPAGGNGKFKASVNLNATGHSGTLFKRVTVTTDKGTKDLLLRINILPEVIRPLSDAERMAGMQAAKVDRQAIFHGDCASCHAKNIQGQYGEQLYRSVCGICHDSEHRASIVPDLSKLTVPTNPDFWRTWITYGKPGSVMPAFAITQGGVLTDMQIATLISYLNFTYPSHAPATQ